VEYLVEQDLQIKVQKTYQLMFLSNVAFHFNSPFIFAEFFTSTVGSIFDSCTKRASWLNIGSNIVNLTGFQNLAKILFKRISAKHKTIMPTANNIVDAKK